MSPYFIPAIGTVWLVYYRACHAKATAASKQLDAEKTKVSITGYDTQLLKLIFKYFTSRLVATAGYWFTNNVFFY